MSFISHLMSCGPGASVHTHTNTNSHTDTNTHIHTHTDSSLELPLLWHWILSLCSIWNEHILHTSFAFICFHRAVVSACVLYCMCMACVIERDREKRYLAQFVPNSIFEKLMKGCYFLLRWGCFCFVCTSCNRDVRVQIRFIVIHQYMISLETPLMNWAWVQTVNRKAFTSIEIGSF